MKITRSNLPCSSLGMNTANLRAPLNDTNTMFLTINPWTKSNHHCKVKGKTQYIQYASLPTRMQAEFCIKVLESFLDYMVNPIVVGTLEFTEIGNVHLHCLIQDDHLIRPGGSSADLWTVRKTFKSDPIVVKHTPDSDYDHMNNLYLCNDSKTKIKYMDKCYDDNIKNGPLFNFYRYPDI